MPDRYGNTDPAVTVKNYSVKNNKSSATRVTTVDNAIANRSVGKFNDSTFSKKLINKRRGKILM